MANASAFIFDVGHGSCVLVEDGAVLTVVDCRDSPLLIDFFLQRRIKFVTQVVISHADADHIDGVLALIQSDYVRLGTVFVNADASKDTVAWTDLRLALQDAARRGKLQVRIDIGDGMAEQLRHETVSIEVIAPGIASRLSGPGGRTAQGAAASSNTMSVVLRLHHDGHPVMLIPGDLDQPALDDVVKREKDIQADVLIFPHHGGHISAASSQEKSRAKNEDFAKQLMGYVKPHLVLFSIGRGRFETPRPEIVAAIQNANANCYVRCTQLSERCEKAKLPSNDAHLSRLPAVGRPKNHCCGGSLQIVFAGKATMRGVDQRLHDHFVKSSVSTPLCRSRGGTR